MAVDERTLRSALRELAEADVIAFGPVGFAGTTLPATEAYWTVADGGADVTRELERLVTTASPAGRIYAATLLDRLDPVAARTAWQRLAADRSEVTTFSGCILNRTTVAEFAADRSSA